MKMLWHWFCFIGRAFFQWVAKRHLCVAIAIPFLFASVAIWHGVLPTWGDVTAFGLLMAYCLIVYGFARYFVRELDDELAS